jgi:DNA-binding beta-propeller fold protein YncE
VNLEAKAASPPLEYVGEWGKKGNGPDQLDSPRRLSVDAASNVYVADPESGYIHKFSATGEPRLAFQDDRMTTRPDAVAVDAGGAIYAADGERGSVFIYFPDGSRYRAIHCFVGKKGANLALAVDERGVIFVADGSRLGVRMYDARGRWQGSWGRRSAGSLPGEGDGIGVASDMAIGPDGFVYMADAAAREIHVFTREGSYQRDLRLPEGTAPAPVELAGIAVTQRWVFAADPVGNAVHVWDVTGQYRLRSDLGGKLAGSADSPEDVAVMPGGDLLVLDPEGGRVLRFRVHL